MSEHNIGVSTCIFRDFQPDIHLPMLMDHGIPEVELLRRNCLPFFEDEDKFKFLKDIISRTGLQVNSIHVQFSREMDISNPDKKKRDEMLEECVFCKDRLLELEGRCLVIHPSSEPIKDSDREERLSICIDSLLYLKSKIPGSGAVKVAVEPLPRTCLGRDSTEMMRILHAVDSPHFGICMDANHANLREDIIVAARVYGARIFTVHVSDNDGIDERHWLPGRGIIPWEKWRDVLLSFGYKGPFMYEIKPWEDDNGDPVKEQVIIAEIRKNAEKYFLTA